MTDALDRLKAAVADRYAVERELGAGGMANVYLAEDLRHHRKVALKVLRPEIARVLGDRFQREIETTAQLTHPHILPLLDSGDADGTLFYVMPYVEGESLRERLTREHQLQLDDAIQITREVADALSYAHRHGVLHRDIKPENILLESDHAVVADFGIARAIDQAGGERLTETGVTLGTPAYMSPEQAMGNRDLDGRSDVYSLGCMLYEMLSAETPYTGPTPMAIMARKLADPLPRISVVRDTVPPGVEAVLAKALARVPTDRYATASEFAAALTHPEPVPPTPAPAGRQWWHRRALRIAAAAVVLVAVTALALARWLRPGSAGPHNPRTAIAVLPLENLSAEGAQAYFAPGLQDELLTQLSKVAALTVISRTSVMGYQGTTKSLRQIASELGVGSVVEGSVQVVANRLRVNVQLIDAATDRHLWAEQYDRTLDDAFAVQSEVAQAIVGAVGARLTEAEASAIAAAPSTNAEAYRLYLQGREYYLRPGYLRQNFENAQRLYERALALDPGFALAHAALSEVHGNMYWSAFDPSPARAARQREEAEVALRLAPALPQAHFAVGLVHYWDRLDYRRALEEFATALKLLPNDEQTWAYVGYVHRRWGNWNEAVAALAKAAQLDPRDANLLLNLGATYRITHRYAEAVQADEGALSLAPDLYGAAIQTGWTYAAWRGQLDTIRAVLSRLPREADVGGPVAGVQVELLLLERRPDSLLQVLRTAPVSVIEDQDDFTPDALYAAWAHLLRDDRPAAGAAFDSARVLVDSVMRVRPDDWRLHAARGLALAGLGRRAEALREAEWLRHSVVYREDAFGGANAAENRARILAQAGDADGALEEIQRLLAAPSWLSGHTLQLDPRWDPIRRDPRFQALLRKYGG